MRIGICHQMQVYYAIVCLDICNVCYPQLVHACKDNALGLILVLAEVMIGVGRVTTSGRLEHQVPLMHEAVEPVTPAHLIWIEFLEHEKKLEGAKPWCLAADILDRTYYLFL